MISVVIPVMDSFEMTKNLFQQIVRNTVVPSEIFLIDNGSRSTDFSKFPKLFSKLNIQYIRFDENRGVNLAWNEGLFRASNNYISILNNDLIITDYFFEKIISGYNQDATIGILVPTTVNRVQELFIDTSDSELINLEKREGWAFTIKKEIIVESGMIPFPFKIYYGDDFLFSWAKKLGFRCKKIINDPIFHYGSMTVKKIDPRNKILKYEGLMWKQLYSKFFNDIV